MAQNDEQIRSEDESELPNPQLVIQLAEIHRRILVQGGSTLDIDGFESAKPDIVGAGKLGADEQLASLTELLGVLEKMRRSQFLSSPDHFPQGLKPPDNSEVSGKMNPQAKDRFDDRNTNLETPHASAIETHGEPNFTDRNIIGGSRAADECDRQRLLEKPTYVPLDNVKSVPYQGLRIGRFQIRTFIGQGGFGMVFAAYDDRLERNVALKIPNPEATLSPDKRRRFLREGRAAAALNHPHIVGVLEAGEEAAICYIATEFIDGDNLMKWKEQRGKLPQQQIAELLMSLAEAVQHAHSRQILHRDLKPSNVLMKGDKPMISDFGLALRLDEDASLITGDSIVGTPAFMAPEQAMGQSRTVDARADVYALGGILYFLLTDKPPLLGSSTLETLEWVRSREPIAPRSIDPTISADLQSICLKCLEKEPERRYASSHELYLDLKRFTEGKPVMARPVSSRERLVRWGRRNPRLSFALASSVFFMLSSLVASMVGWVSTSRALHEVEQANVVALAAQKQSDQRFLQARKTVDEYFTRVAANRLLNVPGLTAMRRELLQSALDYYVGFLKEGSDDQDMVEDVERAHFRLGEILADLGKPADALEHFRQSEHLLEQMLGSEPEHFSRRQFLNTTWSRIAKLQMLMGQPNDAMTSVQHAIDGQQQLLLERPNDLETLDHMASMWQQQAVFQRELRQPDVAHQTFVTVVDLREQLLNADPENIDYRRELLSSQGNLANSFRGAGQIPVAAELSNAVVEGWRELAQRPDTTSIDRHSLLKALYNRALLALAMRQFADATGFLAEASGVADQLALMFPGVEVHVRDPALMRGALAVACMETGDIEQAMESFRLAESVFQNVVDLNPDSTENQIDHALSQLNYGAALGNHAQDYAGGRERIESARESLAEVLLVSPGSFSARMGLINSHINLAAFAVELEEWEVAHTRSVEAVELLEGVSSEHEHNPQVRHARSQAQVNLAKSLQNLDR